MIEDVFHRIIDSGSALFLFDNGPGGVLVVAMMKCIHLWYTQYSSEQYADLRGVLAGMADPLSFVLGNNKYKSYKYVPWGHIDEVR